MNSAMNANTQIRKSVIAELNWDLEIDAGQILSLIHISEPTRPY